MSEIFFYFANEVFRLKELLEFFDVSSTGLKSSRVTHKQLSAAHERSGVQHKPLVVCSPIPIQGASAATVRLTGAHDIREIPHNKRLVS